MIGCQTSKGIEYITKLEHFKELMESNVYAALIEYLNNEMLIELEELRQENGELYDEVARLKDELEDFKFS